MTHKFEDYSAERLARQTLRERAEAYVQYLPDDDFRRELVEWMEEFARSERKAARKECAEIARHFANDKLSPEEWPKYGLVERQWRCDGGFASLMADQIAAAIERLEEPCGQPSRDAELLRVCDDPSIIYYGPYECETCKKRICRVEKAQGGMAFDYPEGTIYPNTNWTQHVCQGATNGNANN